MLAFALYLLKVMLCSGILFAYYWLILRNKVFHQYNRFYLIGSVMLSLLFPLITINIWHNADTPAPPAIKLLQVVNSSGQYFDDVVITNKENDLTIEQVLSFICLSITLVLLFIFITALVKIRLLFRRHQHRLIDNICLVNTTAKGTPFSFLSYIFWNDNIDPESPTGNKILKHELAHVQQKHSHDKLLINFIIIFSWINPFFWLTRKELNMIHEFMADKIAVENNDTDAFAAMVLHAAYPQHRFHLTNPFFYSPIKRRLMMLTKNNNSKASYIGRLLVLPLAVLIFAAFTLKAKTFNAKNSIYNGKSITVVVDAGHGGSDLGAVASSKNIAEKDITLSIIKKIKELNKNNKINIVLTRESDISQTLQERVDFTKTNKADLFISIHVDANEEINKSGMSIWVAQDNFNNTPGSKLLASAMINEFSQHYSLPVLSLPQQREMGIKVLQAANCPAVLVEAGNISNSKDLEYLQSDAGIEALATTILSAVETYAFTKNVNSKSATTPLNNKNVTIQNRDTIPTPILKDRKRVQITKIRPVIDVDPQVITQALVDTLSIKTRISEVKVDVKTEVIRPVYVVNTVVQSKDVTITKVAARNIKPSVLKTTTSGKEYTVELVKVNEIKIEPVNVIKSAKVE